MRKSEDLTRLHKKVLYIRNGKITVVPLSGEASIESPTQGRQFFCSRRIRRQNNRFWNFKHCHYMSKDQFRIILYGVIGIILAIILVCLILKQFLPLSSSPLESSTPLSVPTSSGNLGFQQERRTEASSIRSVPRKDEKDGIISIHTLAQLNNLHRSVKSIRIMSIEVNDQSGHENPIEINQNVQSLILDAKITKTLLSHILISLKGVRSLSLNVDKLRSDPGPDKTHHVQLLELQHVQHLRIVNTGKKSHLLQWILAWKVERLKRLVICKADISPMKTCEQLRGFVNATSSTLEELVLRETEFCAGCDLYDIKLDLKNIEVLGREERNDNSLKDVFEECKH